MTTLAGARAELIAALEAASLSATETPGSKPPPYVAVLGGGVDFGHIVRGSVLSTWRLACVAGLADAKASVAQLDALKLSAIGMLLTLAGWQLGEVRPDGIRSYAGSDYLTADVTASRYIDL